MTLYSFLVFWHILLFVFWLGGDLGVAILGDHFRKRSYSMPERLTILKLLTINDLGPRFAWALMVASSISLVTVTGYWEVPVWGVVLSWIVSLSWVGLVIKIHNAGQSPSAAGLKRLEFILKWLLAAFYLGLGTISYFTDWALAGDWLAAKAFLFGLIFVSAILIDIMFKPVGPALKDLLDKGSNDETEFALLKVMNRSRFWVRVTYVLLVIVAFLGTAKPF